MATFSQWVAACRPRTLPAAIAPVAVGIAIAHSAGRADIWRSAAALVVALAVQIGTNFSNDYADGMRGTDRDRVGPQRLVASGAASPGAVLAVALLFFLIAGGVGLVVALETSLWLIAVGAASMAAGWFYTGGPRPYGYAGYGEVFVFIFFGPVAVLGTTYVASGTIPGAAWLDAVPVGLLSVALLVVNNLRDIEGDRRAGKQTLAVRVGARATRMFYRLLVIAPFGFVIGCAVFRHFALISLLAMVLALSPLRIVSSGATRQALIPALAKTGRLQLVFGVLLAVGLAL